MRSIRKLPPDQQRCSKEGNRLHVPGGNPEPGAESPAAFGEYADPLVHRSMKKIKDCDENERYANEDEIVVLDDPARFPYEEKNSDCDRDRREFDCCMEEREVVPAHCVEDCDDEDEEERGDNVLADAGTRPGGIVAESGIFC